ncbi:MAG: hypothetical protein NTU94_05770 [Planctomycetota bacterium]|nr:hypothetical protein [Planctomycetota bacterium]
MRHALLAVFAAVLVAGAALPVRAQGEFPLKYVESQDANGPTTYTGGIDGTGPEIKVLPKGLAGKPTAFRLPLKGPVVWAVLDKSASPPKLYVDAARTGHLWAVEPLMGTPAGRGAGTMRFGPIAVPVGEGKEAAIARVLLVTADEARILGVTPAGSMVGDVKLAGASYRVTLIDGDLDGRYASADLLAAGAAWQADMIAIGPVPPAVAPIARPDGGGRVGCSTNRIPASEVMPLAKAVRVKDTYYRVQVAPDGASIRLEKYEPKMGTLDIGVADARLRVMSDTGYYDLTGSDGKWQVPEGKYQGQVLTLSKTDAGGKTWTFTRQEMGPLAKFEVRGGETTAIKVGPPLALKVDAKNEPPGQVSLEIALAGKGGERYSVRLNHGGSLLPPPTVQVFDASGNVLAEGKAEYG